VSTSLVASPTLSTEMMNHEDSMFSAPSETFGNRGNPFLGEGK